MANAESGTPDALARDLGLLIRHLLGRSNRGVFQVVEELDLPFSQTKIVMSFTGRTAPRSLGSIADELGLSLPAVSRAVDGLCKRGLVTRTEDPDDRRSKLIAPTDAGRELMQRLIELRVGGIQDFVTSLSDSQREQLAAALEPVVASHDLAAGLDQPSPASGKESLNA
jgi:DNA-binding MarR family transcriptional regulator